MLLSVTSKSSLFKHSRLRVKSVLEVRVLAPNSIAKVARYTIRARKLPKTKYLCLAPGATRATACS